MKKKNKIGKYQSDFFQFNEMHTFMCFYTCVEKKYVCLFMSLFMWAHTNTCTCALQPLLSFYHVVFLLYKKQTLEFCVPCC